MEEKIRLSKVVITNINGEIHALKFMYKDICVSKHIKAKYLYCDLLDSDDDKIYGFYSPVEIINPMTYYMTIEEITKYSIGDLTEKEKYTIIARAIKYEQERLNKKEHEEIQEIVKKELKI